ncbi:MAG TPA: hypothetical protein VGC42_09215 [Kofleriaceae bacterium]
MTERIALGEDLGEDAGHVMTCARCQGLVSVSRQLGAAHHDVDPGLGFTARMTVGAQHRLAVRRRRKLTVGLVATVACSAIGVVAVTHLTRDPQVAVHAPRPALKDPTTAPEVPDARAGDDDLATLIELSDTAHDARRSAGWAAIQRPLAPYHKLLQGVTP